MPTFPSSHAAGIRLRFARRARRAADRGASAVEYGLMVAAIAATIVAVVFGLGDVVRDAFQKTTDCVAAGGDAPATCAAPSGGEVQKVTNP